MERPVPIKKIYFFVCLIGIIFLSSIRSGPIYGKFDFILLDPVPWWHGWQPMIENIVQQQEGILFTDALTANVMNAVFNTEISNNYQWRFKGSRLNIFDMDRRKNKKNYRCVINLHGFPPSWVPGETHHWHICASQTLRYYHYNHIRGKALRKYLKQNPPVYCDVYF